MKSSSLATSITNNPNVAAASTSWDNNRSTLASPSRASKRDSVGLSERSSPSTAADVEEDIIATGLNLEPFVQSLTTAARGETSKPEMQQPSNTLPMELRDPKDRYQSPRRARQSLRSINGSRSSALRSHSDRTTQDRSPIAMGAEMVVDAEPGTSENNEASAGDKVKLDKPALTWKELVSLSLRRSKSTVGITSNDITDWILKNVPGYKGKASTDIIAAILSNNRKGPNAIFNKKLNAKEGPKWVWSLVPRYRDFIDVEKVERIYAAALSNSTPRRHKLICTGSTESLRAKKVEVINKQPGTVSTATELGGVTHTARKSGRERSNAHNELTDDEPPEDQPLRPVKKASQAIRKSTPARVRTKRRASPSSSSGDGEDKQPTVKSPSKAKCSKLNKTKISYSGDLEASNLRRSGRKTTSSKLPSQNHTQYPVQSQSSPDVFSTRSGRQIKPSLQLSANNKRNDQVAIAYSDINQDGTEGSYFSDHEVKGSRAAKDLGPPATSVEAFLSEAFGHLDAEDAKQEEEELPLFKQYEEDPLYGGSVTYSVKDLFAARPDKDIEQNGTFFDREAKMKEIAKKPKRSDLRRYRKENRGESMPYLRTIRESRNPKNPYVEKDRSDKLWEEDDDADKYANSDEDFNGVDENGVTKYKNMQEMFEMPCEPRLSLGRDDRLVFREPQAIGANGRVKRGRQEWRV